MGICFWHTSPQYVIGGGLHFKVIDNNDKYFKLYLN